MGLHDELELFFVASLVWMMDERLAAVGFLDIVLVATFSESGKLERGKAQ